MAKRQRFKLSVSVFLFLIKDDHICVRRDGGGQSGSLIWGDEFLTMHVV